MVLKCFDLCFYFKKANYVDKIMCNNKINNHNKNINYLLLFVLPQLIRACRIFCFFLMSVIPNFTLFYNNYSF